MSAALSKILGTNKSIEEPLDYNPIYKINYLVNGSINTIFVFYGQPIKVQNEEQILQTIFYWVNAAFSSLFLFLDQNKTI